MQNTALFVCVCVCVRKASSLHFLSFQITVHVSYDHRGRSALSDDVSGRRTRTLAQTHSDESARNLEGCFSFYFSLLPCAVSIRVQLYVYTTRPAFISSASRLTARQDCTTAVLKLFVDPFDCKINCRGPPT